MTVSPAATHRPARGAEDIMQLRNRQLHERLASPAAAAVAVERCWVVEPSTALLAGHYANLKRLAQGQDAQEQRQGWSAAAAHGG